MTLSDKILAANGALLDEMLDHRFVQDIANDRLPRVVFHRYLAFEGAFVETAVSIFAFATARAPDMASQRWLIAVLDALANRQVTYFEEINQRRAIDPPAKTPAAVIAFDQGMLHLAQEGRFVDIVTAMFAAEWMYWTWCSRVARRQTSDPDLRAWIDLHAEPEFEQQARWLKSAIDQHAAPDDLKRLTEVFAHVTQLEIDFHHAAYEEDTP
ncbi:MAG: TenA family protein [Roseobacter sp.]|jgi:thiaminase/transcriptional activator TenA|nr:TenA family protein [Roseobacter sp.]